MKWFAAESSLPVLYKGKVEVGFVCQFELMQMTQ